MRSRSARLKCEVYNFAVVKYLCAANNDKYDRQIHLGVHAADRGLRLLSDGGWKQRQGGTRGPGRVFSTQWDPKLDHF